MENQKEELIMVTDELLEIVDRLFSEQKSNNDDIEIMRKKAMSLPEVAILESKMKGFVKFMEEMQSLFAIIPTGLQSIMLEAIRKRIFNKFNDIIDYCLEANIKQKSNDISIYIVLRDLIKAIDFQGFGAFDNNNVFNQSFIFEKMYCDEWGYGILLVTGRVLAVKQILKFYQDINKILWIDVEMGKERDFNDLDFGGWEGRVDFSPNERTTASINSNQIVLAFELMTS